MVCLLHLCWRQQLLSSLVWHADVGMCEAHSCWLESSCGWNHAARTHARTLSTSTRTRLPTHIYSLVHTVAHPYTRTAVSKVGKSIDKTFQQANKVPIWRADAFLGKTESVDNAVLNHMLQSGNLPLAETFTKESGIAVRHRLWLWLWLCAVACLCLPTREW